MREVESPSLPVAPSDRQFRPFGAGASALAAARWRDAHEAFEAEWRASTGDRHTLAHALAQLAAALLKWSEGRPEPAATLFGRVRQRLERLPSEVDGASVEVLENSVQNLQNRLDLGEAVPTGVRLVVDGGDDATTDAAAIPASCPYCGEEVTVQVEAVGAPAERYVEDCSVCCRPWRVDVRRDGDGPTVTLQRDDD